MCYSAQIETDYRKYTREFGAQLSLEEFVNLYWRRRADPKVKIPKAMELAFAQPENAPEREIKNIVDEFNLQQATRFEAELFTQRKRLADAERTLQTKTTKAAIESKRIAPDKIEQTLRRLADLRRTELKDRDARIYPGYYAPVIVMEQGQRVVKPMRYQCRPAGKPAFYDTQYPGTYNARRDNLTGFWKTLFGHSHGILIVNAFYENVDRTGPDGTVSNEVLEFKPRPTQDMLVACLWSRWSKEGEPDLLSFAAITDEPPAEVAAAGHDRCIIPLRAENVDAWLNPNPQDLAAQFAILDDRQRPYYEHRLAA